MLVTKVSYRKDRDKYQLSVSQDGERKRLLFDSEREAILFGEKLKLGVRTGDSNSITIDSAIKSYYSEVTLVRKSLNTQKNEKRYFNLMFHFMTTERHTDQLADITLQDLEAFQQWLGAQDSFDGKPMAMGPSSVNRAFRCYRHFFRKHVQWKNLTGSPCLYLDNLDAEEQPRRAMTQAEYSKAVEHCPEWFKPTFRFIHLTGAPPSCVERLVFDDVDFAGRGYVIKRRKGRKNKLKKIYQALTDDVHRLFVEQGNRFGFNGPVFRNMHGKPMKAVWCSKHGNRVIKAAGLSDVTLYGLRHGLATDLTDANVPTEVVRQVMGHASSTTTQRYSKKAKTETLENALRIVRGGLVS